MYTSPRKRQKDPEVGCQHATRCHYRKSLCSSDVTVEEEIVLDAQPLLESGDVERITARGVRSRLCPFTKASSRCRFDCGDVMAKKICGRGECVVGAGGGLQAVPGKLKNVVRLLDEVLAYAGKVDLCFYSEGLEAPSLPSRN